jgi:hypothetical protein
MGHKNKISLAYFLKGGDRKQLTSLGCNQVKSSFLLVPLLSHCGGENYVVP